MQNPTRRTVLASIAAATAAPSAIAQPAPIPTKPIRSTGEALPLVGLGSWITFNVGDDPAGRDSCANVMRAFFAGGGRMIDSSPMYGSSQAVIGYGIKKAGDAQRLFAATKVWVSGGANGPAQIEESRRLWRRAQIRPPAGAQSPVVGGAPADAVCDEEARQAALCRRDNFARPPARRA